MGPACVLRKVTISVVPSLLVHGEGGIALERGQRVLGDVLRDVQLALLDHEPLRLRLVDVPEVQRGELVRRPAAPVARVLPGDVDDVGLPLLERVRSGAGGVVAQPALGVVAALVVVMHSLGADDEQEAQAGQEGVVGLVQVEHDRGRRRRLHLDDRLDVQRGGLLQRLRPLHRELDRGGVERRAVVELHSAPQRRRCRSCRRAPPATTWPARAAAR